MTALFNAWISNGIPQRFEVPFEADAMERVLTVW